MMRPIYLLTLLPLLAACPTADGASARAEQAVDSVLPREVELQRFRADLPEVAALSGGAPSRDALVAAVVRGIESGDTTALAALVLSRAEYAWLYYPTSAQGLPPYDLAPSLYWFMLEGRNRQGLSFFAQERSGRPLRVVGYDCGNMVTTEGANRLHGPCVVRRLQAPGDTATERYFSQIIERDGVFKVVTYYGDQD
jgi:hypothetical protein